MPPELLAAFHRAVRFGPDFCPPDLFEGSNPEIVRGLKVHANNIARARHAALEETYPRLMRLLGTDSFHAEVERFLDDPLVFGRSLDELGRGFEDVLPEPGQRDLARAEWAWVETFHAAEGEALGLPELAQMSPDQLLGETLILHPAARCVPLEAAASFNWDRPCEGDGEYLLVTRPDAEVLVRRVSAAEAEVVTLLAAKSSTAELLDHAPTSVIALIEAGAVQLGERS